MLKWFHGLRVSQKLMLIGIFFMIPDSIMLYLFITEINTNIAVARLEQVGNAYQRPLERLLDLVPRHRLLAREALGGDAGAAGQLAKVSADIDAAFDALEATDGQIGPELEFTPEGLAKRNRQGCDARSVRREWDRLSGQMDGITPAGRDACDRNHLRLIADLRTMVSQAGDVSNLILDPDIDSYYLMDVTLLALPVTQDRLAQVMADGADLIRGGGTDAKLRVKVAVGLAQLRDDGLARVVASSGVCLNDNKQGGEMGGVCGSLQSQLPPALADYVAAAERFDDLTERVASSPAAGVPAAAYLAAGTAARDASYAYWRVAVDQVNAILQNRIDYYVWRRTRSLGVAGCALLMAVMLVTFITRSITNPLRRRAEQAVAESEDRYARMVSNVPGMVFQYVRRADGTRAFTFVGDGAREIYGLEPDALRADPAALRDLVVPEDLPSFGASLEESARTLGPWRWEGRVRHRLTGATHWTAGASRPRRQANGDIVWDGVATDVTAIKAAEAAAAAAARAAAEGEARVARITANVPGMVYQFLLRPDGTSAFTFVGDAVRDLFGLEPHAVRGDAGTLLGLIVDEDLQAMRRARDASARDLLPWTWEGQFRHPQTGAVRWIAVASRPERQPDGGTLWDGVVTDVTAIKVAEMAAEAAAAVAEAASVAKSEFLATMSHEIRTPLNGVVGMAELLAGTPLSPQQARYAEVIRTSSDTLLSLINDILDFSKIEAGKMELDEADFDLNATVEQVATLLAQKAAAKGLELACDVDPAVPARVRGDGDRLRQVLTNLVNNAIKFTAAGEVVLRVSPAADTPAGGAMAVRFAVTDTGIGIPPDRLDRLFKSFSQVDASTTRRFGGTGLGLAISKQLVELMGGRIGVQSEVGKGSTFWFTVVLRRAATADPAVPAPAGPHSLSDRRLLVADANPTQRRILQNQLTAWGARVTAAATGEAAVELLRSEAACGQPFAAAVVDADLPDLAGPPLVAAVRAVEALGSVPLILTCGARAAVDPADAPRHGFAAGLAKPVRQSHLFDAVMAAVVVTPPAVPAPPAAVAAAGDGPRTDRGARILLVDDMEVNQFIATEILARAGYAADLANNGREAVEAVARRPYELVLMDCQMPEMSGFEAAAAIRAHERQLGGRAGQRAVIIALTANALKGDRERCVAAGMDDYLTKPLNPTQLIQTIAARIGPGIPPPAAEPARAA